MLNSSNLYNSEWLALVFKNRNQNYGAYVLRTQSDKIIVRSLLIAASVFILFFIFPTLIKEKVDDVPVKVDRVVEVERIVNMEEIKPKVEKPKPEEKKLEQPKAALPKPAVKSINLTSNIVVVDKPIVADPPKLTDLKDAVIASVTQDGLSGQQNALPVGNGTDKNGTAIDDGKGDGNEIFGVGNVEAYPEFPGGMNAWAKFIQRNLRYPYMAQENGVQGKVFLSFVVEKDGSITDVNVIKGIGSGCDEEAVRVIKKSPKWKAGIQNNRPVRVRYNIPINYTMQ